MGLIQTWRRSRLDKRTFPAHWRKILQQQVSYYRRLDYAGKNKLEKLVRYFMTEKSFEGCGGMLLDEPKQLVISSLACIPLLGDVSDLYPNLRAILVYPDSYQAPYSDSGIDGVVTEGVESRSGESWDQGVIVFSWNEVEYDLNHPRDGANIVFHECAHQLDYEWGATMEPFSWQGSKQGEDGLAVILKKEYQIFLSRMERGRPVYVDDYAAANIHEFFAVMTETWLERPDIIKKYYPEVNRVLHSFYNMKPVA